nr:hypothetical protein Iba_chr07fCG7320 [Ipomoea batatas]
MIARRTTPSLAVNGDFQRPTPDASGRQRSRRRAMSDAAANQHRLSPLQLPSPPSITIVTRTRSPLLHRIKLRQRWSRQSLYMSLLLPDRRGTDVRVHRRSSSGLHMFFRIHMSFLTDARVCRFAVVAAPAQPLQPPRDLHRAGLVSATKDLAPPKPSFAAALSGRAASLLAIFSSSPAWQRRGDDGELEYALRRPPNVNLFPRKSRHQTAATDGRHRTPAANVVTFSWLSSYRERPPPTQAKSTHCCGRQEETGTNQYCRCEQFLLQPPSVMSTVGSYLAEAAVAASPMPSSRPSPETRHQVIGVQTKSVSPEVVTIQSKAAEIDTQK